MDKITLYYFLINGNVTLARGENIKLLLVDAGLDHEYIRISKDKEWPELKADLQKDGAHRPTLPYIQVGGKRYSGTVPVLRYLSAKLGKYNGSTPEEAQYVDMIVDIEEDWFHNMVNGFKNGPEGIKTHQQTEMPNWLSAFDKYYGDNSEGPYLLGNNITYADIMVYHMIDDEGQTKNLGSYSNLQKFVTAFEQRPNIAPYLASLPAKS